MAKQIIKSDLIRLVEEGKKREDIMNIYGLKGAQVSRLMQAAGLKFKKTQAPAFELVDDTVDSEKDPAQLDLFENTLGLDETTNPVEGITE